MLPTMSLLGSYGCTKLLICVEEHNGSNTNFKIWLLLRIGDGSEVKVLTDKWIPNHPTNVVIHPPNEEERE